MIKFNKKEDKVVYDDGPVAKRHVRKRDYKDKEFLDRMREIKMIKQDPDWYYTSEELTAPFAKIPFNRILGIRNAAYSSVTVPSQANPNENITIPATSYVSPGIMCINFIPTMGYSDKASSPLNVAANKNFAFMRRENAGSTNYTDSDLMMYYISVVGLIPAIKHAIRALKVSAVYTPTSRYMPDLLVKAMGFNPTDLRNNFENYRGRVNRLIVKFNQFPVPANFKHIKRWEFLCDNVFMDRNSTKAQTYFYRPIGIPMFNDVSTAEEELSHVSYAYPWGLSTNFLAPGIKYGTKIGGLIDLDAYLIHIENALARLYNSSDIAIMAGDTLKAFSTTGVYTIPTVKEFEEIVPVYSEMGIRQFHNTEFLPIQENISAWIEQLENLTVTQELSADVTNFILKSQLLVPGNGQVLQKMSTMLLNIDKPNPDWKDVIEITRTKMSGSFHAGTEVSGSWNIEVKFASEIYVNAWIYSDAVIDNPQILVTSFIDSTSAGSMSPLAFKIVSAFDWAPIFFTYEQGYSEPVQPTLGEIDNYTFLSGTDLDHLNEAIIQDLFNIG